MQGEFPVQVWFCGAILLMSKLHSRELLRSLIFEIWKALGWKVDQHPLKKQQKERSLKPQTYHEATLINWHLLPIDLISINIQRKQTPRVKIWQKLMTVLIRIGILDSKVQIKKKPVKYTRKTQNAKCVEQKLEEYGGVRNPDLYGIIQLKPGL